jgi:crotonobetainyl-CoA:carnitine CoA-transferase CaiB-like acyl-CoA transferase
VVAPLEGLRVVEVGDAGGGEWLGRLLAGLGAEVTKVEPPAGAASRRIGPFAGDSEGPDNSLYFWHFNAGKRSVTLDIESEEGRSQLRGLVDATDVFIDAMPLGQAQQRGLGYQTLSAANPRLVYASITAFGQDGPYVEQSYQSSDLVTMALGGVLQSCGYDLDDGLPPMRPGPYHAHYTGGHYSCFAVMAALWERELSGQGQYIDVAEQACLAVTNEFGNLWWEYMQMPVRRQTARHAFPTVTAPMTIQCEDGGYLNIMLGRDPGTWNRLVAFLREHGLGEGFDEALLTDPARRMERSSLAMDQLAVVALMMPAEEMFHIGQSMGMTWGAVRPPEAWVDDPHAKARDFFGTLEMPQLGRSVTVPGAPIHFGATPMRVERAPLLGEHNGG